MKKIRKVDTLTLLISIVQGASIVLYFYLGKFQINYFSRIYFLIIFILIIIFSSIIYFWKLTNNKIKKTSKQVIILISLGVSVLFPLILGKTDLPLPYCFLEDHELKIYPSNISEYTENDSELILDGISTGVSKNDWVSYSELNLIGDWHREENLLIGSSSDNSKILSISWRGKILNNLYVFFRNSKNSGKISVCVDETNCQYIDLRNNSFDSQYVVFKIEPNFLPIAIAYIISFICYFSIINIFIELIYIFLNNGYSVKRINIFVAKIILAMIAVFSIISVFGWGREIESESHWNNNYIGPMKEAIKLMNPDTRILIDQPRFAYYLRPYNKPILMYSKNTWNLLQARNYGEITKAIKNDGIGAIVLTRDYEENLWKKIILYDFLNDENYAYLYYSSPNDVYLGIDIYMIR